MNIEQAKNILRTGLTTFDEQHEIITIIESLERDAERYRWLNKYTAHLFMVTEKGLDEQMNRAMGKGEKG
jgi:hypothetical protein